MFYITAIAVTILLFMWFSTGFFTWLKFMWCCGEPYRSCKTLKQRFKYLGITFGLIFGWPVFYVWLAKKTTPKEVHEEAEALYL